MSIDVICVCDYFLPGFKAGGPIRTLSNISPLLRGAVEFYYLTRDHDLGCTERYENIMPDAWASYPHGQIFYATRSLFGPQALSKAMVDRDVDIIYLNSFFGFRSSISIVARNRIRSFGRPILLAPRGEFSPGALSLKGAKKRLFMTFARIFGLYRTIWWHASTEDERRDILRHFPDAAGRIFTAEDPVDMALGTVVPRGEAKPAGIARLVFVSRISPKKNLDGLLEILKGVKGRVRLCIHGPVEDEAYWRRCQAMIDGLPENISVEYRGELHPDAVSGAFAQGDLFAFPTHGENFGHVIFEALRAGTPVLVSDQTPWKPDSTDALARVPLTAVDIWRAQIDRVAQLTETEQQQRRMDTLEYARRHATADKTRQDNLRMFAEVARRSNMKVSK